MIEGQSCFRFENGPPVFTLPHRVKLADGTTRTDATQWFPDHSQALGWAQSTVTAEEAAAYDAGVLEQQRAAKITQLNQWWVSLENAWPTTLGFAIKADAARLTALQLAATLAGLRLQQNAGLTTRVWDSDTILHHVDDAVFLAGASAFEADYLAKEQSWIDTRDAINAALTLAELNAVEMP